MMSFTHEDGRVRADANRMVAALLNDDEDQWNLYRSLYGLSDDRANDLVRAFSREIQELRRFLLVDDAVLNRHLDANRIETTRSEVGPITRETVIETTKLRISEIEKSIL